MRIIQILGNPIVLISLFCLILISGEHIGGFYLLYILLGAPYFSLHSLLAIAGISVVIGAYSVWYATKVFHRFLACALGALLMLSSLITFFIKDEKGYNDATFEQTLPLITLLLFGLSILCYLINCFQKNIPTKTGKIEAV